MDIKIVYKKIDNLLDIEEHRDLTTKEDNELSKLKKLRNKLDPQWLNKIIASTPLIFNI